MICEGFVSMKASTFILCSLRGCWLLWCLHFLFFQDALLSSHTIFFYNHSKHYRLSICICKCESVRVLVHWWCSWMQHRFLMISTSPGAHASFRPREPDTGLPWYVGVIGAALLRAFHPFCITLKDVYGFLMLPRTTSRRFLSLSCLLWQEDPTWSFALRELKFAVSAEASQEVFDQRHWFWCLFASAYQWCQWRICGLAGHQEVLGRSGTRQRDEPV